MRRTEYIVHSSAEKMPMSCWGVYRRVAVLEVYADATERERRAIAIDTRRLAVKRIVAEWRGCNVGKTDRCAYAVAMRAAAELAEALNKQQQERETDHE